MHDGSARLVVFHVQRPHFTRKRSVEQEQPSSSSKKYPTVPVSYLNSLSNLVISKASFDLTLTLSLSLLFLRMFSDMSC